MKNDETFLMISAPVNITVEQIKDLLCCAFSGGSNYWATTITRMGVTAKQAEYRMDVPFVDGGWLEVVDEDGKVHRLDKVTLTDGLVVMSKKYPTHFADVISENTDATTGDVYLQCCVFGEVVYG